jgi:5-methylcytosine-specific restriction enzyme subunit McrC
VSLNEYDYADVRLTTEEIDILKKDFCKKVAVDQISQDYCRITAKQYVGNIVLPQTVLIIRPKIFQLNFYRMFFLTYNLTPEFYGKETDYTSEKEIFELIISRFLDSLDVLTRRGFSKCYVEEEANLLCVKGRILIRENLKLNPILHHKIFCRFSDFTSDTTENKVIKYTLYHLLKAKLDSKLLQKRIKQALHLFDQVSFVTVSVKNFPQIRYTRLNEHYKPIINLCYLIIQNLTLNLQENGEIRYSSFLVDMNRLFENFLLGLLKKNLKGFSVRGSGKDSGEYSLDLASEMTQKPDIIISKEDSDILVIDAKYKQLNSDDNNQVEIITSDVRQVWSYCLVPKIKLPFGMLVYPKHLLLDIPHERYSLKNGVTLVLKTLDLSKSKKEDFAEECTDFVKQVLSLVNIEIMPKIQLIAAVQNSSIILKDEQK